MNLLMCNAATQGGVLFLNEERVHKKKKRKENSIIIMSFQPCIASSGTKKWNF